jgi:hypothetical protein
MSPGVRWLPCFALAAACQTSGAPDTDGGTYFADDRYGLAFVMPAGWSHRAHGSSHVFAGPDGPTSYTTLTVQGLPAASLDEALERAYGDLDGVDGFGWDLREPVSLAGRPALRYALHFDLHETPRRKAGVVLDTGRAVVDVSYAGPDAIFPLALDVYEDALATLSVY